jgi:DNA helicase-2/ATP-dependent DNA helicase PcrA
VDASNGTNSQPAPIDHGTELEGSSYKLEPAECSPHPTSHIPHPTSYQFQDLAVLYRTNAQSRALEETLLRSGLPYRIVGGVKFYERKEIKDVLAYLRVLHNPADSIALLRIINTPPREIGLKTIEYLQNFAHERGINLHEALSRAEEITTLPEGKRNNLKKFWKKILDLQKMNREYPASGVVKHVLSSFDFKKFLDDGTAQGQTRYENTLELLTVASKYDGLEPSVSLATFLEEVALIAGVDEVDEKENAITLMTVHSAKGLEFPVVFVAGLEQGLFPHSRSLLEPSALEEERRLFYVAVTRACDRLYLLHARERTYFGEFQANAPSEFLLDLPAELIETAAVGNGHDRSLRPHGFEKVILPDETVTETMSVNSFRDGERVIHKNFGEGVVVQIAAGIATIAFRDPQIGIKKLALSVAPLRKM